MKANRLLGTFLAVGLGLVTMADADVVLAAGGKPKDAGSAVLASGAPSVKKSIDFPFTDVAWGMSPKQVVGAVNKLLDDDYRPLYKTVQPGVKMKALDAQLAEDKSQFERGRIEFGKLPTGFDSTPLRGEFTYQNKEALMTLDRSGQATHFFFIRDRLWKVIQEVKLSDTYPLGKSYPEVAVKLSAKFGVPGRVLPADATRSATEIDWKDSTTHLRLIQRGDTTLALGYEDNSTLGNLASMRTFKPVEDNGIDPVVAAAMRGASAEPGPPPGAKDAKKGPKK